MLNTDWNCAGCLLDWCLRCVVLALSPKLWCLAVAEGSMTASDAQIALRHPWELQQAWGRICEQTIVSVKMGSLTVSMLSTLAWCNVQLMSHLSRHLCKPGFELCQQDRSCVLFWFCSLRPLWLLVIVSAFVAVTAMAS